MDGWCDVASDTALLLAVGWLLSRQERTRERLLPLVREDKERLLPVELRLLPVEERLLPVEEKLLPAKERLSPGVHWPWLAVLLLGLQVRPGHCRAVHLTAGSGGLDRMELHHPAAQLPPGDPWDRET